MPPATPRMPRMRAKFAERAAISLSKPAGGVPSTRGS
jgi:hypothetical protein